MPELPEVEHFRFLLEPLISSNNTLHLERGSLESKPPRKFLDDDQIAEINQGAYHVSKVMRKGKLIAMTLVSNASSSGSGSGTKFLMIHMGMTGRISTPDIVPELKEVKASNYPPPHVYLKFSSGSKEACFSDPRKFGSILVVDSLEENDSLAPDAWKDVNKGTIPAFIEKLANQSIGIKAMLLDQRRVISGVGNWVADEVLYQTQIHPDQTFLTNEQAGLLLEKLHWILTTAVQCLIEKRIDFPNDWLFHYRWNSKKTTNDAHGRVVTFITSGGRTSAIVPSLQQKRGQSKSKTDAVHKKRKQTVEVKDEDVEQVVVKVHPGSTKKRKAVTVKEENEVQAIETLSGNTKKAKDKAFQEEKKIEMKATKKSAKKTTTATLSVVESSSSPMDRRRRSARLSS